jgi:transcriptional regulator with XRE-family HTH domain
MMSAEDLFDFKAFYRALDATREARAKSWKQVADESSVSASTLARMSQDKRPDASGLAALAAWSGLNPGEFVTYAARTDRPEPLAAISSVLSQDPSLDPPAAAALEDIIRAAYARLARRDEDPPTR